MAKMPKNDANSSGAISKEAANYRKGDPAGDRCETCGHYRAGAGMCELVEGQINPGGISDYFEPIQGKDGREPPGVPGGEQQLPPPGIEEMLFGGGMPNG